MASRWPDHLGLNACWLCELGQLTELPGASVSTLVQRQGDWYLAKCSREDAVTRRHKAAAQSVRTEEAFDGGWLLVIMITRPKQFSVITGHYWLLMEMEFPS